MDIEKKIKRLKTLTTDLINFLDMELIDIDKYQDLKTKVLLIKNQPQNEKLSQIIEAQRNAIIKEFNMRDIHREVFKTLQHIKDNINEALIDQNIEESALVLKFDSIHKKKTASSAFKLLRNKIDQYEQSELKTILNLIIDSDVAKNKLFRLRNNQVYIAGVPDFFLKLNFLLSDYHSLPTVLGVHNIDQSHFEASDILKYFAIYIIENPNSEIFETDEYIEFSTD